MFEVKLCNRQIWRKVLPFLCSTMVGEMRMKPVLQIMSISNPCGRLLGGLGLFAFAAVFIAAAPAAAKQDIKGIWYDDTGKGAVELHECQTGICGRIYWLSKPTSASGQPLRDQNNPVPANRKRPICGLPVIGGLRPQSDGSWDQGRIYDPKVGRTYDVAISRAGANRLKITGYLGAKFLGRSFYWRRAPGDLARCS